MKAYLTSREKEVIDSMIALFEQEEAVKRYGRRKEAEGEKKALEATARRLALNGGDVNMIMAVTELPEAEARRIYEEQMAMLRR